MFRWAAFTDEISQDLAHACTVCNEFGVPGAELRGVWDTNVADWSDAQVREIKKIIHDHGMTVCSIGSPFGKCELEDTAELARQMDVLRRCADIARELDCTLVRGFVFWGHGRVEKPWDAMLRAYEPVPAILEEKQITLGVENEWACLVGTAGHLRQFLDRFACPRAKAVWDPANHIQDVEGDALRPYPEGYELLKKDVVHVHVKDAIRMGDGTAPNVFLGQGLANWEAHLKGLRNDGYDGFVSLETHVDPKDFPEELRPRYGQYLTGEGREGASKVCLAWLRDAVADRQ